MDQSDANQEIIITDDGDKKVELNESTDDIKNISKTESDNSDDKQIGTLNSVDDLDDENLNEQKELNKFINLDKPDDAPDDALLESSPEQISSTPEEVIQAEDLKQLNDSEIKIENLKSFDDDESVLEIVNREPKPEDQLDEEVSLMRIYFVHFFCSKFF